MEDHSSTAEVLKRLLLRAGHQVQTADSLAEARRWLAKGDFDLLISDLGLPDGSGLELVRDAKMKGLRAIALSGYGMDEDVRTCLEGGFDGHVTKRVDWRRLKAIIQRLLSTGKPLRRRQRRACHDWALVFQLQQSPAGLAPFLAPKKGVLGELRISSVGLRPANQLPTNDDSAFYPRATIW